MKEVFSGDCLCGAVRYACEAEPGMSGLRNHAAAIVRVMTNLI
jgi:hypothetical protein